MWWEHSERARMGSPTLGLYSMLWYRSWRPANLAQTTLMLRTVAVAKRERYERVPYSYVTSTERSQERLGTGFPTVECQGKRSNYSEPLCVQRRDGGCGIGANDIG